MRKEQMFFDAKSVDSFNAKISRQPRQSRHLKRSSFRWSFLLPFDKCFFFLCYNSRMKLKIERLEHNRILPEYKTAGAAGMDLCAAISEPMTLQPLERKLVPTGLKIELEHGYEAQVRPRSGLSIKHGITLINCVGTIDEDYRGELLVPIVNLSNVEYTILPDERIAQMVISKYEQANIEVVTELSDTVRGEGGFGSTGKA